MTELEKTIRAKMYIDKLANGVNPLDDTEAPDDDVINDIRISRCLFFVSDLLRQVIENGGLESIDTRKRAKKLPLDIPFESRNKFDYSEIPISVSEIARRINLLIDTDTMQKLTYSDIVAWLTEIGMMKTVTKMDGRETKRPTDVGNKNGIFVENRMGRNGLYPVVVYNSEAQHFVIDNLDAIIAAKYVNM